MDPGCLVGFVVIKDEGDLSVRTAHGASREETGDAVVEVAGRLSLRRKQAASSSGRKVERENNEKIGQVVFFF